MQNHKFETAPVTDGLSLQFITVGARKIAYRTFGDGKIDVVVEMGLGAVIGEWLHVAEMLAMEHTVLLYERAGYGGSDASEAPRTPANIAHELWELLSTLPTEEKLLLIGHSQGGLYAQQFARFYPDAVKGLLLLDPLTAENNRFRALLTPEEFRKSGVDKFANLRLPRTLARLHLGGIIKAFMKNAPPFYYYNNFSNQARLYILQALTKPAYYNTAMEEYRQAHMAENLSALHDANGFPDIPLVLITHSSALAEKETMEFGDVSPALAAKVEQLWQELMRNYLSFSRRAYPLRAENSTHYIHLTQPELLRQAFETLAPLQ